MTLGPELIGIRSRVADERCSPVSDQAKSFIKIVNVVGVPLLIALLGSCGSTRAGGWGSSA